MYLNILKMLRSHDAIRVVKTWVNAWCASARFGEVPGHPCYFGCSAKDDMRHYVMCPALYTLQRFVFEVPPPPPLLPDAFLIHPEPLQRLGIHCTSERILKIVACTFSGYHAIKFKYSELFAVGGPWHAHPNIPEILHLSLYRSFSDALSEEARELGLPTRRFDPEVFYEFLSSLDDQSGGTATASLTDN